jgi:hypothetical protein
MVRVPLACSLTAENAAARIEEWKDLLGHRVVEVARGEGSTRLRLADSDETLLVAVDLARRETTCCPFLEFHLVLLAEAIWLEVHAPEGAQAILDAMVKFHHA